MAGPDPLVVDGTVGERHGRRGRTTRLGDDLIRRLLALATAGLSRIEFLRSVSATLARATGCDEVGLWLREDPDWLHTRLDVGVEGGFEVVPRSAEPGFAGLVAAPGHDGWRSEGERIGSRVRTPSRTVFLKNGCAWSGRIDHPSDVGVGDGLGSLPSVAVLPLAIAGGSVGWLRLGSAGVHHFDAESAAALRRAAETLALVIAGQGAEAALRERVKELTCLYSLSQVAEQRETSLEDLLAGVVSLLPPAWQYPEIAVARIEVGEEICETTGFATAVSRQSASIRSRGEEVGRVVVGYTAERPELDEGPFLHEERSLINAVARELAVVIERRRAAEERALLQGQLLHADRLATIGQLSAGLAHELNEPLAAILGFAQLSQRTDGLPEQTRQDLGKIATAALHAREIVRKLMLFARQTPPRTGPLDLNDVVRDSLELLGSRCAQSGVEVACSLEDDLPAITADRSQVQQVLINLMVNSLHAMPAGGHLEILTRSAADSVVLTVRDDGVGMDPQVVEKIFLPFFTTKDVDQGTGLGLAVVHGIVSSHGGSIAVDSEPGRGSSFEVSLPVEGPGTSTEGCDRAQRR